MISVASFMDYPYGPRLMIANIYEYCPKPLHCNANMVKSVNNIECWMICDPDVFYFTLLMVIYHVCIL